MAAINKKIPKKDKSHVALDPADFFSFFSTLSSPPGSSALDPVVDENDPSNGLDFFSFAFVGGDVGLGVGADENFSVVVIVVAVVGGGSITVDADVGVFVAIFPWDGLVEGVVVVV